MSGSTNTHRTRWLAAASISVLALTAPAVAAEIPAVFRPQPVKNSPVLDESGPAAGGPWLAWASNSVAHPNRYAYYIAHGDGPARRLNALGTQGGGGGLDGHFVAYTQSRGGDSDSPGSIFILNLATGHRSQLPSRVVGAGAANVSIALPWVLFTRTEVSKTGESTRAVVLYNRRTGQLRRLAESHLPATEPTAGQVAGDWAAWKTWLYDEEATITRYRISTRTRERLSLPVWPYWEPAVAPDGTVYLIGDADTSGGGGGPLLLVRYPRGGPAETVGAFPQHGYEWMPYTDAYLQQRANGARWIYVARGWHDRRNSRDVVRIPDLYQLTVTKAGTGTGTVSSSPARITCGSICTATFRRARVVTLTAVPDLGSVFSSWNQPTCGTAPTCTVTMTKTRTVTATFTSLTS